MQQKQTKQTLLLFKLSVVKLGIQGNVFRSRSLLLSSINSCSLQKCLTEQIEVSSLYDKSKLVQSLPTTPTNPPGIFSARCPVYQAQIIVTTCKSLYIEQSSLKEHFNCLLIIIYVNYPPTSYCQCTPIKVLLAPFRHLARKVLYDEKLS